MKAPAFQIYVQDFDMDTATWENEQIGAYLRLLFYEWVNGGLPDDTYKLSKIVRETERKFKKNWEIISKKFSLNGNGLFVNKRLEEVRQNQAKFIESQREKGVKSAKKRWEGHITPVTTTVTERLQPDCNSSSSSSSSSSNNKKNKDIARSGKPKRALQMADEDYIKALKENPAFKGIDVDREVSKLDAWLLTPRGRGKQRTQQRLFNWLCRAEKPMQKEMPEFKAPPSTQTPEWIKQAAKEGWKI